MTTLGELLETREPNNGAYRTVCIDGRGASGKTTLADLLGARLPGFDVVHGDDYFEPHKDPVTWGDFNEERLEAELLAPVRAGARPISIRPYDFPRDVVGAPRVLPLEQGLVFERCFAFALPVAWDLTIWVEASRECCLSRGLARDGAVSLGDRARTAWEQVWQPREDRYLETMSPASHANLVLDGTRPFDVQLGEGFGAQVS